MIGEEEIIIDEASNIYLKNRPFKVSKCLWELTRKKPNMDLITQRGLRMI
jgi:hypothetical protein